VQRLRHDFLAGPGFAEDQDRYALSRNEIDRSKLARQLVAEPVNENETPEERIYCSAPSLAAGASIASA
jgi:hypothetical protein